MSSNPSLESNQLLIDSHELLIRFLWKCKNDTKNNESNERVISTCADIVAAVYYFRRYPNVNEFLEKYLKNKEDYFQLQWIKATWAGLSKMTESELSNLVINQIYMVDHSAED